MTHAGFWVDGAVRKPEARHANALNHVVYQLKGRGEDSVAFFTANYKSIDADCVWLDTTPRESLTPEELFSVLRILWPNCEAVFKPDDGAVVEWQVNNHFTEDQTAIDWGNLTQYPPPVESKWIRVTRENVGQYLFRNCRTQKNDITYAGRIVGWCIEDDCCLVESDYQTEEPILQWDHVEVEA